MDHHNHQLTLWDPLQCPRCLTTETTTFAFELNHTPMPGTTLCLTQRLALQHHRDALRRETDTTRTEQNLAQLHIEGDTHQ